MLNNSWLSPCALQAEIQKQCLLAERLRALPDLSRSATKALAALFVGITSACRWNPSESSPELGGASGMRGSLFPNLNTHWPKHRTRPNGLI
jgi:hypothetical protein